MRLSYLLIALFAAVAMAANSVPAHAGRPAAVQSTPSGHVQQVVVAGRLQASSVAPCQLGVTDAHLTMNYLYPPDDEYYTLLDPSACGCAGSAGVSVSAAHAVLDFPEPCSIPVTVAIVAADLSDPSCPMPVRGQYLCPPVNYDLTVSNAGGYDFVLPLPLVCVSERAFLQVTFRELGDCGNVPSLYVSFASDPCVSWNYWPDGILYDLYGSLLGNPTMYVDAACCDVVPVSPSTWGKLKSIYR